ncbi:hypothetical protein EJ419_01555 [Alloscardovia theropitheci]|uniref:Periplasmic binding protein domain-containing protein n=1 Tax=Alloscardovia theropitheci TaxID=2496842 RepID=A0A4R0QYR1_9BIFI|nr:substrate-binding domain-containing protein [Alloscardovia theropitheci]TCD54811.1 hypothetical protein EJ419_01555 [Alloscardovia theropitheci]
MALALCTCASCSPRTASSNSQASSLTGTVDIVTPTGNSAMSSNLPLNNWESIRSSLVKSLKTHGFVDSQISESHYSDLSAQINQIKRITNTYKAEKDKHPHTLIFAPHQPIKTSYATAIAQRFGDTVTQNTLNNDELEFDNLSDSQQDEYTSLHKQLASALKDAQDNGITVVLMSHKVPDFSENYFISFATAQSIARIQTDNLVRKLQLDKATIKNPQAIEIIIPLNVGAQFAQQLFSASWKILKPYYTTGVAFSPSGLLDANSTEDDWRNVSVPDDSADSISSALKVRLTSSDESSNNAIVNVDGILAFNDYIAQGAVSALTELGFTGSSAQVNPDVTLDSIIKKLSDNVDVHKQRVPQPNNSSTDDTNTTDSNSQDSQSTPYKKRNPQPNHTILTWPIVTGFGTYIDAIADIVNGKIWISSAEERNSVVSSIAALSRAICEKKTSPSQLEKSVPNIQNNTVTAPLFAVNSDNLKKTLLDTGYITPAEAGL